MYHNSYNRNYNVYYCLDVIRIEWQTDNISINFDFSFLCSQTASLRP